MIIFIFMFFISFRFLLFFFSFHFNIRTDRQTLITSHYRFSVCGTNMCRTYYFSFVHSISFVFDFLFLVFVLLYCTQVRRYEDIQHSIIQYKIAYETVSGRERERERMRMRVRAREKERENGCVLHIPHTSSLLFSTVLYCYFRYCCFLFSAVLSCVCSVTSLVQSNSTGQVRCCPSV